VSEETYVQRLKGTPLPSLRTLRESLQEEERQVSYWRRLVQGRLDLVRAGLEGKPPNPIDLARLAARRERAGDARRSPASTHLSATGVTSPLGGVEALWDTPIPWQHLADLAEAERALVETEVELSVYRRVLHQRIDLCTAELVERYQRDPSQLAMVVLPT
jgi:hypothetical protein